MGEFYNQIDKPKTVLTEWQRKRVEEYRISSGYSIMIPLETLEKILSEPEPPKYNPKQGEGVLVRSSHISPWHPRVFAKMFGSRYQCYALVDTDRCNWNYCIQFNADLVGNVTD